jgi:hypothetical protein
VLLVFGAPCQLALLAGREHGRTIPLTDLRLNDGSVYRQVSLTDNQRGEIDQAIKFDGVPLSLSLGKPRGQFMFFLKKMRATRRSGSI